MMKKLFALFAALVMLLSLAACGGSEGGEVVEDPVDNVESEQQVEEEPQKEEEKEPEKELEPIVFTGSGDDVVEIGSIEDGYVFHITGNAESRHFSVTAYNGGEYIDLLVNTSDPYEGITLEDTFSATMLEIKATGDWTVELLPGSHLDFYKSGETATGNGDSVFVTDGKSTIAEISGNSASRHFSVSSYGNYGYDLLVNTTDPYSGKVMLTDSPILFVVSANDSWSIAFN